MNLFLKKSQWTTRSGYKIFRVNRSRSRVYLLSNGTNTVLVDTGVSRNWRKLRKDLENLGITHIDLLILTHTHFDHAGNAIRIKEKYGASVAVHKMESEFLEKGFTPLPRGTNFFSDTLVRWADKRLPGQFRYRSCKPDILLENRKDLSGLGFNAYILHTPGHTAGSVSLIVDDEIAIVGDCMFGIFRESVFPPFANDIPLLIKSWETLLDTGCKLFIPAHGSPDKRELVKREFERKRAAIS
jgi:hydroxyacylglutathione hydrolase